MNAAPQLALAQPFRPRLITLPDELPPDWPGIHDDISIEAYHAMPGISRTGLDMIHRSPAHFYGWHIDPLRPERRERAGQLEGTLAHCALLEPREFSKRYVTEPVNAPRRPTSIQRNAANPSPNTIKSIAFWDEFEAKSEGKTIITVAQYETAMRQAQSMRKLPDVAEALEHGKPEVTACWIDARTGEMCRCRPDWVQDHGADQVSLLDVKTCGDASAAEFRRQIARKRYHVQDAFYCDGFASAGKVAVMSFTFVAVESEWPYQAQAIAIEDKSREQGRREYRRDLLLYAQCRRRDEWPGYGQEIQLVDLPPWAFDN